MYWEINEREQSLATLQSIVDYHQGEELKKEAKEVLSKYQAIIEAENEALEQKKNDNAPEVIFDSYDQGQEELFEDGAEENQPNVEPQETDSVPNPNK